MSKPIFSGLSVLIVDDIRAMRALLRALLRTFGIEDVIEAADGAAALEILRTQPRDLVITDLWMKPMDGIEFTRQLRQRDGALNPHVPVLIVSAHTEAAQVKRAVEVGVTEFLAKPVTPAALQLRLKTIIERPKAAIQAHSYYGPDRRRMVLQILKRRRNTDGPEDRSTSA